MPGVKYLTSCPGAVSAMKIALQLRALQSRQASSVTGANVNSGALQGSWHDRFSINDEYCASPSSSIADYSLQQNVFALPDDSGSEARHRLQQQRLKMAMRRQAAARPWRRALLHTAALHSEVGHLERAITTQQQQLDAISQQLQQVLCQGQACTDSYHELRQIQQSSYESLQQSLGTQLQSIAQHLEQVSQMLPAAEGTKHTAAPLAATSRSSSSSTSLVPSTASLVSSSSSIYGKIGSMGKSIANSSSSSSFSTPPAASVATQPEVLAAAAAEPGSTVHTSLSNTVKTSSGPGLCQAFFSDSFPECSAEQVEQVLQSEGLGHEHIVLHQGNLEVLADGFETMTGTDYNVCGMGGEAEVYNFPKVHVLVKEELPATASSSSSSSSLTVYPAALRQQKGMTPETFTAELAASQLVEKVTTLAVRTLAAYYHPPAVPGQPFMGSFLMPRCKCSLADIAEHGPLQPEQVMDILAMLLQFIRSGLLHCDIKGSNIMVDLLNLLKMIDLAGVVRADRPYLEQLGCRDDKWSFPYSTWDRILSGIVTVDTEIFSIGLTCIEMLIGSKKFEELLVRMAWPRPLAPASVPQQQQQQQQQGGCEGAAIVEQQQQGGSKGAGIVEQQQQGGCEGAGIVGGEQQQQQQGGCEGAGIVGGEQQQQQQGGCEGAGIVGGEQQQQQGGCEAAAIVGGEQQQFIYTMYPQEPEKQVQKVYRLMDVLLEMHPEAEGLVELLLGMACPVVEKRLTLQQAMEHEVWEGYDWNRVFAPLPWLAGVQPKRT